MCVWNHGSPHAESCWYCFQERSFYSKYTLTTPRFLPPSLSQSLSHAFPKPHSTWRLSNICVEKLLNKNQLGVQSISTSFLIFFYFPCILWKKSVSSLHILKACQFFPADFAAFSCYASIRLYFASTDKHHRIKLPWGINITRPDNIFRKRLEIICQKTNFLVI